MPVVARILVADATRSRLLVVGGDRPALPGVTVDDFETVASIRGVRQTLGIPSAYLRPMRYEGEAMPGETVLTLDEYDAPPAGWEPEPPFAWLPFAVATSSGLDAGPFDEVVAAWIREVRSGARPSRRPDWARPGWFEATTAWLAAELASMKRPITGPVEQLGSWAISSLMAVETATGRVVLKSVPPPFVHEPALTRVIAAEHPGSAPAVLTIDPVGRHLVMEAFGGTALGEEDPARWGDGLVAMARIQQAWIGRREAATRIGVSDRTLAALGAELESIVTAEDESPNLDPGTRARLVANLGRYHDLIGRLQAGPVPETLVHGDLHPWNINRDDGRLVIYDWSDASWSHPFFDVSTCTSRTEDLAAREAMRTAFLEAWTDYASPAALREALSWAEPLSELHLAISWRRLQSIFEPDHGFAFVVTGVQRHLEAALAATDRLP